MNKYPGWLNVIVLVILLTGILFALPNIYGSAPAIQLSDANDQAMDETRLAQIEQTLGNVDVDPEAAFIKDGRVVLRFDSVDEQRAAEEQLRARFQNEANIALTLAPKLPDWVRNLGLSPMSLGLDLRGGVYVLLEVDMATAIENRMESYELDFDDRLRDADLGRHRVDRDGDVITVRLADAGDLAAARQIIRDADPDVLIADGPDGSSLLVRLTEAQIEERRRFAIEQNVTTLRNRVNQLGVAEPLVQQQGLERIVVQLPGLQDPNEVIGILDATATIEFRLVDQSGTEPGSRRYPARPGVRSEVLKRDVIASGDQIVNAESGFTQDGQPAVFINLDSIGGDKMLETTQENVGKPMATLFIETKREEITRNGETEYRIVKTEEIVNIATIRGVFKNSFQTTGLNPAEARELALLLRAGALAAPVYIIDQRTIGPSLGQDNIDRGFQAVQIGFLAVIVFMAVYYRWFGMIANVALFSNLVFIVALLSMLQASLTLPGIAGIVLTVGMAVDANVLIFERIREELSAGAQPQSAISSGYDKALSSIADANITTFIAAIVLFAFGTGPIKGFAITLSLGIVTSMFTAIVGTRAIVNLAFGGRKLESVPV